MRITVILCLILGLLSCHTSRNTSVGDKSNGNNDSSESVDGRPKGSDIMEDVDPDVIKVSDVFWASPEGFDLTMDIYTPNTGRMSYPVIVMFHGGGWLINDKSIMDQGADYLARHSDYIVCNVNYRLLVDQNNTVTIDQIIEDAFGAVLWVKANIAKYKGDPSQVIVTGDSAGGHLAAMVATHSDFLASGGIEGEPWGFNPSWLPAKTTAEEVAAGNGLDVQAAIISYGAFDLVRRASDGFETSGNIFWELAQADPRGLFGTDKSYDSHPRLYQRASANHFVPAPDEKDLPPMLFTVGEKDNLTTPALVKGYRDQLKALGHDDMDYWEHKGRPHAFLDSGTNEYLGITFERDAIPALKVMIEYLDSLFYPGK